MILRNYEERNYYSDETSSMKEVYLSLNLSQMFLQLSPLACGLFLQYSLCNLIFMLFQFKDANHHCPRWKPRRLVQMIQRRSKMTHDSSEFCQEPPESSGRWECPALRRSVQVNPRCLQTQLIPHHVLPWQQI